jgi:hypothetical protein
MTPNRLELLMECHERELMNHDLIKVTQARSLKILTEKKLVELIQFRPAIGPGYLAVKISDAGKVLLSAATAAFKND